MLKQLEVFGKLALAFVAAFLLWRPGRRRRAMERLRSPRRILLVRIDNRVGEALLTTPLFRAAKSLPSRPVVDVLVHPKAVRVLAGHPEVDEVLPFDPRERVWGPFSSRIRALRRRQYDVVVNCANWDAPSVGPAIVSRLVAGGAAVVGPDVSPVNLLADVPVRARTDTRSEARQRLHYLSALHAPTSDARLSFRPVAETAAVRTTLDAIGGRPFAVVNPGGRLGYRRVPPELFREVARSLASLGIVPLVTWGPNEESLAKATAEGVSHAVIAPPTTIDELAALMGKARLTVCNNTGPMHLSVAVGTPTLAFFKAIEMSRWGHFDPPHRMVDLTFSSDPVSDALSALRAMVEALPQRAA